MIDQDDGEQLSAWLDGEHVPARAVLDLLERPDALACVRELLRVRASLEDDRAVVDPRAVARVEHAMARARWYARIPRVGWAAIVLLAFALVFTLARRPPPSATPDAPSLPRAEFVADFPTQ